MDELPSFTRLRVWQIAHKLSLQVYRVTGRFPVEEKYGLTSQARRAAVSVESNIAESYGRYHYADATKFLIDGRGSSYEVQTQLLLAIDLGYPGKTDIQSIIEEYTQLIKQINSLIAYKRGKKDNNR